MSKDKKIFLIPFIFLILLLGCVFYYRYNTRRPQEFKIIFLDIGQGDATLIQFNNGQKMLLDCGIDKKILSRLGEALPFYDRTIDYLMVSHPDLDHYGGCVDVLKNYNVKEIITNGQSKPDSFWATFDQSMHSEGAAIKVIDQPQIWTIASSTLEFLSPDKSLVLNVDGDDSNNYSIVFRLINNDKSFLFTADTELPLEKALLKKYCMSTTISSSTQLSSRATNLPAVGRGSFREKVSSTERFLTLATGIRNDSGVSCSALQADILKVGHHGSDTSSGEDFLRAVGASVGVISVGKENKYGHPSRRVLKKLERANMEILRTDQVGSIVEY